MAVFLSAFSTNLLPTVAVYADHPGGGGNNDNVTICHRTNSASNPYTVNTVDPSAIDGNGNGDHFAQHTGPLFNPATMGNGDNWGDIIPPLPGFHSGLNWTSAGQLVYNNGCSFVPSTATAPTKNDLCEIANDTYTIPTRVGVIYSVGAVVKPAGTYSTAGASSVTVTTAPAPGYILSGTASWTLTFDVTTKCPVGLPETPEVYDKCGLDNAKWIVPADTDTIDWVLSADGLLVANAKAGYTFSNGATSVEFGHAPDSDVKCLVTPEEPEAYDYCGTSNDYLMVVYETDGVHYSVDYSDDDLVATVTASPLNDDYAFPADAITSWTFTFTDEVCLTISKTAGTLTDTDGSGGPSLGDVMHWNITVTNTGVEEWENFYVMVTDEGTVLENDGLIESLAPGESVTLEATKALTATELSVCKIINVASYEAWYSQILDRQVASDSEEVDVADFTGSASAEYSFTCPTPGRGGQTLGTSTTKLPATIPATGSEDGAQPPYLLITASVLAYGLTYFIQGRRRVYETQ